MSTVRLIFDIDLNGRSCFDVRNNQEVNLIHSCHFVPAWRLRNYRPQYVNFFIEGYRNNVNFFPQIHSLNKMNVLNNMRLIETVLPCAIQGRTEFLLETWHSNK